MKIQKKGEKGIAAAYVTRNKAIRKLQISLKDFRRLCIVKGIFPRDPKKKKAGKDKTYYHVKDIKFLAHEPLLQKFRELKSFLKKRKTAQVKKDEGRIKTLEKHKPKFTMHHLVKERYPTFVDALRDLDDPLCILQLFAALPANLTRDHKPEMLAQCQQLTSEFQSYVLTTKSLRKVFISIKGIYYQAQIQDVDVRVMLTFLEFYLTMVKFVNFKLFAELGLQYPPAVDHAALARRAGLAAFQLREKTSQPPLPARHGLLDVPAYPKQEIRDKVQSQVREALRSLKDIKEEAPEEAGDGEALDDFSKLDTEGSLSPEEREKQQYATLFAGLVFVLGREVPLDSLEFVLLCGSATVLREDQLTEQELRSDRITHQVVDRPSLQKRLLSRHYVQPQWVFDAFNCRALLPVEPYAPGAVPPPHLSPFVDDESEGYVPAQRHVLEAWGAQARGDKGSGDRAVEEEAEEAEDTTEREFEAGLAKERAGVLFSDRTEAHNVDVEHADESDEDGDLVEDDEDEGESGGEDATQTIVPTVVPVAPVSAKKRKANEELELAKIMMSKKDARLYSKIQYGLNQKANNVKQLETKRSKLESQTGRKGKNVKK